MKVILTDEVHGLGEPGTIVDVAPGYARNFLVPRKLAVYASSAGVREIEHHKRRLERKRLQLHAAALSVAERINNKVITIEQRAGKEGKLYGSVTNADIAELLKTQFDLAVDRRKIQLKEAIRTLGSHEVDVHLMGETHATVIVQVVDSTQAAPAAVSAPPAPVAAAPIVEEDTIIPADDLEG